MSEDVCNVCSSPAAHRCSACKQVTYCSKDHQKQDWKNHKSSCIPFEVSLILLSTTRSRLPTQILL
jgi:hypothetical protein